MLREAIGGGGNRSAAALQYSVVPSNQVTPGSLIDHNSSKSDSVCVCLFAEMFANQEFDTSNITNESVHTLASITAATDDTSTSADDVSMLDADMALVLERSVMEM